MLFLLRLTRWTVWGKKENFRSIFLGNVDIKNDEISKMPLCGYLFELNSESFMLLLGKNAAIVGLQSDEAQIRHHLLSCLIQP